MKVSGDHTTQRWRDARRSERAVGGPGSLRGTCVRRVRDALLAWSRRGGQGGQGGGPLDSLPAEVRQELLDALLALGPGGREVEGALALLAAAGVPRLDLRPLDDCKFESVAMVAKGACVKHTSTLCLPGPWLLGPREAGGLVRAAGAGLRALTLEWARAPELGVVLSACPGLVALDVRHWSLTDGDLKTALDVRHWSLTDGDLKTALGESARRFPPLARLGLPASVGACGLALALLRLPSVRGVRASAWEPFLRTLPEDGGSWAARLSRMAYVGCPRPLPLEALGRWCPWLTAVELELGEERWSQLGSLRALQRLESASLSTSAPLAPDPACDLGPCLLSLSLSSFDVVDVGAVARRCPRLLSLTLRGFVLLATGPCPPLPRLRTLRLKPRGDRPLQAGPLLEILSACPSLVSLRLASGCGCLDDALVEELVKRNPLPHLTSLDIRHGHQLSSRGLRMLTAAAGDNLQHWSVF